ncbi:MAG: thioester reductase domain-containing protein [Prevotella sp.]|nr:thioester reductase domain-containing protein [Prevotella sp.]
MDTSDNDILSVLQHVCQTYPEQTAVAEGDSVMFSYRQLWRQALQVAEYVKCNCSEGSFVGLNLPKSAAYIVGMIGCWMAGKAFVPIGTDLPPARQRFIRDHADIKLCLDNDTLRQALSIPLGVSGDFAVAPCAPQTPAYMIYSSGTTGTPKGILVGHAGLCNLARCQQRVFGVDSRSRYLFFLSVNFDASVSDILVTLTSGATLLIEPVTQEELALTLFDVIERRGATHTDIPPSLLKMLNPQRRPDCLQTIVIGGEPADIATVRRWCTLSPLGGAGGGFRLINVYGPTEATVCTSMCQCDADWDAPLLGDVLDDTHYHIYADGRLDAADGELWISGIGLAIGYYKDEELTRKKFPVVGGVRYYRTSDHVRRDDSQRIVFVGRMDRQVKYHGQLIELEEIEHRLRANRSVGNVAVVKRSVGAENAKEAIVAFVQLADSSLPQAGVEQQLRQCCKHHLPRWMMPSFFEFVGRMPLTPSGKTDLQALSVVALSKKAGEACCQYASKEEETIARVMADILKLHTVAPNDDFFLCGGDSLDTVILISRLQQMGISVTSEELHQTATPRLLAQMSEPEASMCIHSSQLESQWQYATIPARQASATGNARCYLLTGATGFLGSHLLNELLARRCQRVLCLVRCSSAASGLERVTDSFRRFGFSTQSLQGVGILAGDVALPRLGLSAADYSRLSDEVTDVLHCAATVNMLAGYDALKETNVTGTRRILDFCMTGIRKKLHYASTLSVFVSTDRNSGTVFESDDLSVPTNIYGGYGQTKFVAEKMVLGVNPSCCDTFIYRFGLLCGDTLKGLSSPKDFLGMFFRGAKVVGSLPYDKTDAMAVDITPIDQASRAVADIIVSGRPGVYHIAAERPLYYNRLCTLMKEEGFISDIVDYDCWLKTVSTFADNADVQALRMALCRMDAALFRQMRYMDLFQTTGISFDMTNTHAATPQRCRHDKALIKRYLTQPPRPVCCCTTATKQRYKTGFVLGKFCPLHRGHMLLIQRALDECDTVYVVVDNIMDEVIPVSRRMQWVRQQFPAAVVLTQEHPLPQDPSETPRFWDIWRETLLRLLPQPVDAVFASEQYGKRLAQELSAEIVMVDPDRQAVPVSATRIRDDLMGQWHYLAPVVQRELRKVICVYGPESTGKSTLTKQLADHYSMPYVEEYAKRIIDSKHGDICFEDMETIVKGHHRAIEEALQQNTPLLFVDTDAIISKLWSNELFGQESPLIEEYIARQQFDHYLLLDVDLPWVNDVHRYRPNQREAFFSMCEEQLVKRKKSYTIIRGLDGRRFENARKCVDRLLDYSPATASISTNAPLGSVLTATAERAGYGSEKNSA